MEKAGKRLVVDSLVKRFTTDDGGELTVLDGASCEVEAGETVAVVGPSGSGKSTLLNCIGSLERTDGGSVHLGSVEVTSLEGSALAKFRSHSVGFVFQDHHLLPQLTALENVLLPTLPAGHADGAQSRAEELLERIGLAGRMTAFPARMSGGERQRVALARALINRAGLLLCDEPTGNLDRETGASVISLLLELADEQGVTVLMVSHNLREAARFERCLQLRDGRLHETDLSEGEQG
ncbi:MAG: ABC transporter ATP-binding protein [Armatimonadota bacterium]